MRFCATWRLLILSLLSVIPGNASSTWDNPWNSTFLQTNKSSRRRASYPDIKVSGAGIASVNGIYKHNGFYNCNQPTYYIGGDTNDYELWWHWGRWHVGKKLNYMYAKDDGHLTINGCDVPPWKPDDLGPLTSSGAWFVDTAGSGSAPQVELATPPAPPPPPPPPPPTPPVPAGKWPTFASKAALKKDAWGAYYTTLYGELPSSYPIDVSKNWMIYKEVLIKDNVKDIPAIEGDCPTANPPQGQRYNINNMYSPPFLSWVWQPYPYAALPDNSMAEVLHEADPFGDENFGAWFVYAPGSGLWFDIGKTISFPEHSDAYTHFKITSGSYNEELSKAAAAAGYDSIQFLAHVDHVNYQCDTKNTGNKGLEYMGLEIVGSRLTGKYACTTSSGAPPSIKAGWQGSRACACDNTKQYLNCKNVPSMEASSGGVGKLHFV